MLARPVWVSAHTLAKLLQILPCVPLCKTKITLFVPNNAFLSGFVSGLIVSYGWAAAVLTKPGSPCGVTLTVVQPVLTDSARDECEAAF